MPLHDWNLSEGWEGVHHIWITELLRWVRPRLPTEYRAYIGSAPRLGIGAPPEKPDVSVRHFNSDAESKDATVPSSTEIQPDEEVAVADIDPGTALYVERHGHLVAAVELISPRNKDRPASRASYLARYLGYLLDGVNVLLVDVHPRPIGFSFADQIAEGLHLKQPHLPPPLAVSYRVGEPAAEGGRILGIWRRSLSVGAPLPVLPLPLTVHQTVNIDLEQTYIRAAEDAYLT